MFLLLPNAFALYFTAGKAQATSKPMALSTLTLLTAIELGREGSGRLKSFNPPSILLRAWYIAVGVSAFAILLGA